MKSYSLLAITIVIMTLSACQTKKEKDKIVFYPFQSEENGRWGMSSPSGTVIFDGEFEECPTLAIDGFFAIKDSKEKKWVFYTAEEHPRMLGCKYKYITPFDNGLAVVGDSKKPITIINKDGDELKTIEEIEGKKVWWLSSISNGKAVYCTADDSLSGVIDVTTGDVCIEPEYENIYLQKEFIVGEKSKELNIYNYEGKVISSINTEELNIKYFTTSDNLAHGNIIACTEDTIFGILDIKGEWVVEPQKENGGILMYMDDMFIFMNKDRRYGLAKTNGEILIRPKYTDLMFLTSNVLIAKEDEDKWLLINVKDEGIGEKRYKLMAKLDDKHVLAQEGDGSYVIMDEEGNITNGQPKLYSLLTEDDSGYEKAIYSGGRNVGSHDYVDLGLSVVWATCNLMTSTPRGYGFWFNWGGTELDFFGDFRESNCETSGEELDDIGETDLDAAHVLWGGSWRLPTKNEFEELIDSCTWNWTKKEGVRGYKVTGKNGNSIFLPAAGVRLGHGLYKDEELGQYWSSTPEFSLIDEDNEMAQMLFISNHSHHIIGIFRYCGLSIRAVSD